MNNSKQRTIVVGDLHGCWEELLDLLEKVKFDPKADRLIALGDLVDRGPSSRAVIEIIRQNGTSIMGNHDSKMLDYYERWEKAGRPTEDKALDEACRFSARYHKDTFLQLEDQHFEWLRSLPYFIRLPEYNTVLVHAGVISQIPLEQQGHWLMHLCNFKPPEDGKWTTKIQSYWTSKAPEGARFWAELYDGSHGTVLFGHSGFDGPAWFRRTAGGELRGDTTEGELRALGLDTGAVFGRTLSCVVLPDWEIVSVQARKKYLENSHINLSTLAPGIQVYS